MLVLALDCSAAACSVAALTNTDVIFTEHEPMARGHAEALVPMMERALTAIQKGAKQSEKRLEDLAVAVSTGPGAFTGIRIALSAGQGLALAKNTSLFGVSRFDALYSALLEIHAFDGNPSPIIGLLETKRADFYMQNIGPDGPIGQPRALSADLLSADFLSADGLKASRYENLAKGSLRLCGDGAERFIRTTNTSFPILDILENAEHVGRAALRLCALGAASTVAKPLYLRDADTGPPLAQTPTIPEKRT